MIPAFLFAPIASKVATILLDLIHSNKATQISKAEIEAAIQKELASAYTESAKAGAEIVKAEVQSESWLARNWRPISALCFVWIVVWFGWFQPALYAWYNVAPLKIGDPLLMEILDLVKICLGGYIGGRSLEKIAGSLRKP